ncbi:two-component sensor histidine kinase [Blastomonas marina]|uniref:histidine kinase n=1 Tax=Blastomonas marina TaxID=1867408 RepID=A0ABQ1FGA3_9SPHN|nr:ATP-binding protein [Blastomonas marina]GGA10621.1 two-component sensor histidine kinase [Blastomonas marina]
MANRTRLHGWAIAAAALLLCGLLAMLAVDRVMRSTAIDGAERRTTGNAEILVAGLESELEKYSLVPPVLAQDPDVIALMRGERFRAASLDRRLESLARQTEAAVIYLMDERGETLSSSNHARPDSFVGSNYAFREYFRRAILLGEATQFALGTVSRRPGLYIAKRIGNYTDPLGVVVLKVEFDGLEESWRESGKRVYVTDGDGIVLIGSDPDWRFHALAPVATETRDRAEDLRTVGVASFPLLDIADRFERVVSVPLHEGRIAIAPSGWVMHLLVDSSGEVANAVERGRLAVALAIALLAMLGGLVLYLMRRRHHARELDVARRTGLLREQLSQANRLAMLGQMGAGISHEIRQPVAAMRVYAENGTKLLERGDAESAKSNFELISGLADRIGAITGELLRFSRRGTRQLKPMPIGEVIDGALMLLNDRIASQDIAIALPGGEEREVEVLGEHVRLEQVLVNLLQNALDAIGSGGRITIDISTTPESCLLAVSDDGPGLDEAVVDRLFHPFTTTKTAGLGLGLVISRDIMEDLGGDLLYEPSKAGTRFVIEVPRA